ncbi:MAG: hypothetical protein ACRCZ2_13050 [Fusobacteriaceae bacterium]
MFKIKDRVVIKAMTEEELNVHEEEMGEIDFLDEYCYEDFVGKIIKIDKENKNWYKVVFGDRQQAWFAEYALEKARTVEECKVYEVKTECCENCVFLTKYYVCLKHLVDVKDDNCCKRYSEK